MFLLGFIKLEEFQDLFFCLFSFAAGVVFFSFRRSFFVVEFTVVFCRTIHFPSLSYDRREEHSYHSNDL